MRSLPSLSFVLLPGLRTTQLNASVADATWDAIRGLTGDENASALLFKLCGEDTELARTLLDDALENIASRN